MKNRMTGKVTMSAIEDFQEQIFARMSPKKWAAGREPIYDLISVAIQEWPMGLDDVASGSSAEINLTNDLKAAMKRHIVLSHGEDAKYGFIWTLVLTAIISEIIKHMLAWWWNKKEHREKLRGWRKRWVHG
jgi:hypothetical protein